MLKNAALAYLSALPDPAAREMVTDQFREANNMTDIMGSLGLLNDLKGPERMEALDDFYNRYSHNPLVIEKWLALQATSKLPGTLDAVHGLLHHEAFSIKNPNKVRALIGTFAVGNSLRFHTADGSGYEFIADRVIELDKINPHVAARLLPPLGRWRRYDEARQAKMRAALQRVLEAPGLSTDSYEIAIKSLG